MDIYFTVVRIRDKYKEPSVRRGVSEMLDTTHKTRKLNGCCNTNSLFPKRSWSEVDGEAD